MSVSDKLKIRAIIIDDEPLARQGLMLRLEQYECIELIGICASAIDATAVMKQSQPDVIFLDIEMPGMSGIDFAQWIQSNLTQIPKIIFVTAYREFALKAFDFEAFDYLLKPFADDRLCSCISKLKQEFGLAAVAQEHQKLEKLLLSKTGRTVDTFIQTLETAEPGKLKEAEQSISLKSGTEWLRIRYDAIFWIEAAGDYMCVHTQDGTQIIRKTLKELETMLDNHVFTRVSRSSIINVEKLTRLSPNSNGEYIAHLSSGDCVKVSRKFKHHFDELKKSLER